MDDGGDAVAGDRLRHQLAVAGRAGDEGHLAGHQEAKPGRQIVEHDHRLAGVDELVHHVAADIAGPAGDQDGHDPNPPNFRRLTATTVKERLGRAANTHGYGGHA